MNTEAIYENLTEEQKIKIKQRDKMLIYGLKHKKIIPYNRTIVDNLRPYQIAGFPVSLIVLINELCNGLCYDRADLISLAFEDAKVVHGDIESLRVLYGEEQAEHAFVETKAFGKGKTWVVDTSIGLIFEKKYYYKHEKVKVNYEISKEKLMESHTLKSIIAGDFEKDKYALPMMIPMIESAIEHSKHVHTVFYKEFVNEELERFKQAIDYQAIQQEIEDDMKLMRTNPQALDEKFQIVRDKFGREISRGGVPNPYYITPEEIEKQNKEYDEAHKDPKKLVEYMTQLHMKVEEEMLKEEKVIDEKAKLRLSEIKENPTSNFYDNINQA